MKFVRFGALTLQKQEQYEEPTTDMAPWQPPCKKGFFAFPAGYMDPFYLPLSRPPEDPHSLLQYLRDDEGNKMTKRDLYDAVPIPGVEYYYGVPVLPRRYEKPVLSEKGKAFLKKRRLKEKQLMWVKRPCWVMVWKPDLTWDGEFPHFYGLDTENEDRNRLNVLLEYLFAPDGEKIAAEDFFTWDYLELFPDNYEGYDILPVAGRHFYSDDKIYYGDGKSVTIARLLKMRQVDRINLCIWPVYPVLEDEYAATLKKYRIFEYEGCLWHHLGGLLKRSEILSQFSDTWYYTDIHAYERALRKASGLKFGKKMKYQRQMKRPGYYGAYEMNTTFDLDGMFEVFFDQRIP